MPNTLESYKIILLLTIKLLLLLLFLFIMPIDIKILKRIQTTQTLNIKYISLIYLNLNN